MKAQGGDTLRLELKAEIPPERLHLVKHMIESSSLKFHSPWPPRRVFNLYWDSWDMRSYRDNLSGASGRLKLRYRWYGSWEDSSDGHFEVKKKSNRVSWKERVDFQMKNLCGGSWWEDIAKEARQKSPESLAPLLCRYNRPVLINSYLRTYYETRDKSLRVTVDEEVTAYSQVLSASPNRSRGHLLPENQIIEIKFNEENRKVAENFLNQLPLRLGRFSKYVQGVQSLRPFCF